MSNAWEPPINFADLVEEAKEAIAVERYGGDQSLAEVTKIMKQVISDKFDEQLEDLYMQRMDYLAAFDEAERELNIFRITI